METSEDGRQWRGYPWHRALERARTRYRGVDQGTQEVKTPIATLVTIYYSPEEWQNRESVMFLLLDFFIDTYGRVGAIKGGRIMSIPIRMCGTALGTIYVLSL